ncbi:MAG: TIGR02206 family membrane protein [FCB group bacterium]|nr:TIGR02206 family membrane protein [FCB group bacterium]
MPSLELALFGPLHLKYLLGSALIWLIVPWVGVNVLSASRRRWAAWVLIILTVGLDIGDDLVRIFDGVYRITKDLPLHLCGAGVYLSAWALFRRQQSVFELAYFWGLAGATQALITPDFTGMTSPLYAFTYFASHSLIVLNILWLVFVDGFRCRKGALLNTFLVTNGLAFVMVFVNLLLGSNYLYLCALPASDSPFLIGDWPLYLIGIEIFGFLIMGLFYLPMIKLPLRRTVHFVTE